MNWKEKNISKGEISTSNHMVETAADYRRITNYSRGEQELNVPPKGVNSQKREITETRERTTESNAQHITTQTRKI